MTNLLRKSFVWQFAGGFVLGAIGLFALQPGGDTAQSLAPGYGASQIAG